MMKEKKVSSKEGGPKTPKVGEPRRFRNSKRKQQGESGSGRASSATKRNWEEMDADSALDTTSKHVAERVQILLCALCATLLDLLTLSMTVILRYAAD